MQVVRIQPYFLQTSKNNNNNSINVQNTDTSSQVQQNSDSLFSQIPLSHKYNAMISFGEFFDPNRTVPHIDYEEYVVMKEPVKKRFRKRYQKFFNDPSINPKEMIDEKYKNMPLRTEPLMDEFIKISSVYKKYKDQPIICLGRSPKWFLNAALWMKGGIDDYKYVAFSKYWFRPDSEEGVRKIVSAAPTEKEEIAYRKYLKRIKADPESIVKHFETTGQKTVITDYICSGKGACSFLDLMSRYADDLGILEKFSKSIQFVGIGSIDYMEELNPYAESIDTPSVPMPPLLRPYRNNIKQEFYNMDNLVFREMLLNQNTNECRSTYYPHETWTIYKPDQFKTGLITDVKKVKKMIKELKDSHQKSMASFTPAMFDFRNLLNFRILDGLNSRGLLKENHKSKI